jgi:hypothetical protein
MDENNLKWCWYDMAQEEANRHIYGPYDSRESAQADAYGADIYVAPTLAIEPSDYIANAVTAYDVLDNANALLDDDFTMGSVDQITIDPNRLQAAEITLDRLLRDWCEKYCCISPNFWVPDLERAINIGPVSLSDCSDCPSKGDCGGCEVNENN